MKRVAVEICIGLIARTIGQSEFFLKVDKNIIKDELYYRLNVRPNKNESASYFWQTVIRKLIYENECLIIKNDSDDLLIADTFTKTEYANYEDVFSHVIVRDYEFKRSFLMNEVVYLRYSNEGLSRLIEEMYSDYGELLGRLMSFQKRKNQIRATVTLEALTGKKEEERAKLQKYIDNLYKSIETKDISITPQTKAIVTRKIKNLLHQAILA